MQTEGFKHLELLLGFFLISFRSRTPDVKLLVFNSETRNFFSWQENQGVVRRRTQVRAQASPRIDAARAKKNRFRMRT